MSFMDLLKFKNSYFVLSGLLIAISIFSLLMWGMNLGIDFKGGSVIEYSVPGDLSEEDIKAKLQEQSITINSIQKTSEGTYIFQSAELSEDARQTVGKVVSNVAIEAKEMRFEKVGPTVSAELIKKTIFAILIASVLILLWVTYQFKSVMYGASAILAMLHDTFILIGLFALFGQVWGAEADFLFVTAVLTTLSFSVHDTIVVFDRIREIHKKQGGELYDIANRAINETMVRSLNNSFTIIFMLLALVLLGGASIKWFAVALLTGTILGTYSSPFIAVPFLITFNRLKK